MTKEFRVRLASPQLTSDQENAVIEVLRSGRLVSGPNVELFEEQLKKISGRKHAVAVSSGTSALLAGMRAIGVAPGSVVVVPAFTFPAPAMTASLLGARVKLCDVDPGTLNISPQTLTDVLDDSVTHVIAIDQFGMPAPTPQLEELLADRDIPLLVDAACSIGSKLNNQPCGSMGRVAAFSFHPRKVITTGEGGAVLTDEDEIARSVRRFRNLGIENGAFSGCGLNLRPSEIGAAFGLIQLKNLTTIVEKRTRLAKGYRSLPLQFQLSPEGFTTNYQTFAAILPKSMDATQQKSLIKFLKHNGAEAQIASYCLSALGAFSRELKIENTSTPSARRAHNLGIALPLHDGMEHQDVAFVASLVNEWLTSQGVI